MPLWPAGGGNCWAQAWQRSQCLCGHRRNDREGETTKRGRNDEEREKRRRGGECKGRGMRGSGIETVGMKGGERLRSSRQKASWVAGVGPGQGKRLCQKPSCVLDPPSSSTPVSSLLHQVLSSIFLEAVLQPHVPSPMTHTLIQAAVRACCLPSHKQRHPAVRPARNREDVAGAGGCGRVRARVPGAGHAFRAQGRRLPWKVRR
eukprot:193645-Chlamydomonas_euryale.AAC.2